jgi:hypothetical protein
MDHPRRTDQDHHHPLPELVLAARTPEEIRIDAGYLDLDIPEALFADLSLVSGLRRELRRPASCWSTWRRGRSTWASRTGPARPPTAPLGDGDKPDLGDPWPTRTVPPHIVA